MQVIAKVPPVAQNSTHEVVPVTDIEEKEIPVADAKSGKIKKVIEKVPVTKNKVIPKTPGATPLVSTPTVEAPLEGAAAATPATPQVATPVPSVITPPTTPPVAQNSTHEVVPVVEEEQKEVTTKDTITGEEKKEIVKVPVTKNKVVPKTQKPVIGDIPLAVSPSTVLPTAAPLSPVAAPVAAPVAQNSTHEVIPVVEEEQKEVTTKDTTTGEEKKEIVKVPVTKNKVVPKG
jgi:hypothetical protein